MIAHLATVFLATLALAQLPSLPTVVPGAAVPASPALPLVPGVNGTQPGLPTVLPPGAASPVNATGLAALLTPEQTAELQQLLQSKLSTLAPDAQLAANSILGAISANPSDPQALATALVPILSTLTTTVKMELQAALQGTSAPLDSLATALFSPTTLFSTPVPVPAK